MGPSRYLWFLHSKQRLLDQNYKSLWVVDLTWLFVHAKQRLWTRITSLYEFKLSSVFLCIENSDFRTKMHVSMGTRLHLWFCSCKRECLALELLVPMGPKPHLWFSACKTACLTSELLVSMSPSSHLRFLHAKQRHHLSFCAYNTAWLAPE